MVIAHEVMAQQIGRAFAERIRDDPAVRELYVEATRDGMTLWLLIEPTDMAASRRFYRAFSDLALSRPETRLSFHLIDPQDYAPGLSLVGTVIPTRAQPVSLHS